MIDILESRGIIGPGDGASLGKFWSIFPTISPKLRSAL